MSTDGPALKRYLLHPSGGLVWHWRALMSQGRWGSLKTALAGWLESWAPLPPRLLLVGPSAGWTLPGGFLRRFREIHALEPDPLARQLLQQRFRSVTFRFDNVDVFADDSFRALSQYPDHAVLFCNVLGQLCPQDEIHAETWCARLRAAVAGMHWASYHDLISCEQPPDSTAPGAFPVNTPLEEVLGRFWRRAGLDIHDHRTIAVARNLPFSCVPWHLSERQWHLVQWCHGG